MGRLRNPPTGNHNVVSRTACRGYLYTKQRAQTVNVLTKTRYYSHLGPSITAGPQPIVNQISKLPYLAMEKSFTVDPHDEIMDAVVTVGRHRFLVTGHYAQDKMVPVNKAVQAILPNFKWRGEIIMVGLGCKSYIKRITPKQAAEALNKFVGEVIKQHNTAHFMNTACVVSVYIE
ncbi:hypothetical protein C8J57DRAFT_1260136 [Mycena rebaudengoi]|nr:hypothetical protein C8J57DRAFT_1260136 [Mycena rebaudengoi]